VQDATRVERGRREKRVRERKREREGLGEYNREWKGEQN